MTALFIAAMFSVLREREAQATQTPRELLGEWAATNGEAEGVELTPDALKDVRVVFTEDGIQISPSVVEFGSSPNPAEQKVLDTTRETLPTRIDATKNPAWLDVEMGKTFRCWTPCFLRGENLFTSIAFTDSETTH